MNAISLLLADTDTNDREVVETTLQKIPTHLLTIAAEQHMRIVVLRQRQTYATASPALKKINVNVDAWPIPPAGLFVVEERTVYLRSTSAMTVAHETMHAIDCALGEGAYLSSSDPNIRHCFERATAFVTPYAASGLDEYFAECGRAMLGVNDSGSLWPAVSPKRLLQLDPPMHQRMTEIFTPRETRRLFMYDDFPRQTSQAY
jgi:hypothetical protein